MRKMVVWIMLVIISISPSLAWAETSTSAEYTSPVLFTFTDDCITAEGFTNGCEIDGTQLTIEIPGTYAMTGNCAEGNISVKKNVTGVVLIMQDFSLSSTKTAPLVCKGNSEVTLFATGTVTLTDLESDSTLADYEGAAIKVKSGGSLTLEGDGALTVKSGYKNAIKGAATSTVTVNMNSGAGKLMVNAANNGIAADGQVVVNSGIIDITAGNEGIKSEPDDGDADSLGAVTIAGGDISIDAGSDGIQATNAITITGGTLDIGADSDCVHSRGSMTISGGSFDLKTLNGYQSSFDKGSASCKGLKVSASDDETEDSDNLMTITGGDFTLNTADDAIHSDGHIAITGGAFSIRTGDDGIHADNTLTLGSEGGNDRDPSIIINSSYEGLESADVYIYGGRYWVVASDDGINAAGGSSQGEDFGGGDHFGPGGGPWGGRRFAASTSSSYSLNIYGGHVYVNCDGDGLDSNGNLNLTGGEIEVWSQSRGDNNPLDYDGTMTIKGATVLAAGNRGMGLGTIASGSQTYKAWSTSITSGKLVSVNSGSSVMYNTSAPKAVSYEIFSSPSMTSSYTLSSSSGNVACKTGNSWAHSWNSGMVRNGVRTYTCSTCGATETESVVTYTFPVVAKTASVEIEDDDAGYEITFSCENATICVYYTQNYDKADETNVSTAVSRNSDTGSPDSSGNGQLNFAVIPDDGYVVAGVSVEGDYKNLKEISTNTYRITKIGGELAVMVSTVKPFTLPAALTSLEDEAFAGIGAKYVLLPKTLTQFGEDAFGEDVSGITFYVYSDSGAESYCAAQGYKYKTID